MKRYTKLLAGASWAAEYGDPDKPDDWAFLKRYSAYHQLAPSKGPSYPPLLMTTSTKDDRVHPYHARAFVKRLLDIGADQTVYYENIEGGHGGAADNKQRAFMMALYIDFLDKTIEREPRAGRREIGGAARDAVDPAAPCDVPDCHKPRGAIRRGVTCARAGRLVVPTYGCET